MHTPFSEIPIRAVAMQLKEGAITVLCFTVPGDAAIKLRQQLSARFERGTSTEIYNADYKLYFVKVPEDYDGFHNCNTELASWLRQLGCDVKGPTTFGAFRLITKE